MHPLEVLSPADKNFCVFVYYSARVVPSNFIFLCICIEFVGLETLALKGATGES